MTTRWRILVKSGLALLFVVFTILDPFDVDHALTALATEAVSRVISVTHPYRISGEARPLGRDQVAVMLIGESLKVGDLKQVDYTRMIDRLANYGARAIVFDISLDVSAPQQADVVSHIAESIERAKAAGVDVIFAQMTKPGQKPVQCPGGVMRPGGILPQQLVCTASAIGQVRWWQSDTLRDRVYPLRIVYGQDEEDGLKYYSLAWATYRQITNPARTIYEDEDDDMFLAWGQGAAGHAAICGLVDPEAGRGFVEHAVAVVFALFGQTGKAIQATCPFIPMFDAKSLTNELCVCQRCDESLCNPALLPIAGRTVFIGIGDPDWEDFSTPPIGPRRPGVFTHATAFENLLTLRTEGSGFYRFEDPDPVTVGRVLHDFPGVIEAHWKEWLLALGPIVSAFLIGQFLWPWREVELKAFNGSWNLSAAMSYVALTMLVCRQLIIVSKYWPYWILSGIVGIIAYCCRAILVFLGGVLLLEIPMPTSASVVIVVFIFELTIGLLDHMVEIERHEKPRTAD